jgi:hypothetical protein
LFWLLLQFHVWDVQVQFMVEMLQMLTVFYVVYTVALQVLVQYGQPIARSYPLVWCCVTDRKSSVRFEVLTAVLLRIQVIWDVTFCHWVSCHGVAENRSVFETV